MKKIILVVLVALVFATPCFAQDIEPNGLFTLDNTLWKMGEMDLMGFAGDMVYLCDTPDVCFPMPFSSYSNFFLFSLFEIGVPDLTTTSGILIPIIGVGRVRWCAMDSFCVRMWMRKLPGSWEPDIGTTP